MFTFDSDDAGDAQHEGRVVAAPAFLGIGDNDDGIDDDGNGVNGNDDNGNDDNDEDTRVEDEAEEEESWCGPVDDDLVEDDLDIRLVPRQSGLRGSSGQHKPTKVNMGRMISTLFSRVAGNHIVMGQTPPTTQRQDIQQRAYKPLKEIRTQKAQIRRKKELEKNCSVQPEFEQAQTPVLRVGKKRLKKQQQLAIKLEKNARRACPTAETSPDPCAPPPSSAAPLRTSGSIDSHGGGSGGGGGSGDGETAVSHEERTACGAWRDALQEDLRRLRAAVPAVHASATAYPQRCLIESCVKQSAAERLTCRFCTNSLLFEQLQHELAHRAERAHDSKGVQMPVKQFWLSHGYGERLLTWSELQRLVDRVYDDVMAFKTGSNSTDGATLRVVLTSYSTNYKISNLLPLYDQILSSFSSSRRATKAFSKLAEPAFTEGLETLVAWSQTFNAAQSPSVASLMSLLGVDQFSDAIGLWSSRTPSDTLKHSPDEIAKIKIEINRVEVSGFMSFVNNAIAPIIQIAHKWNEPSERRPFIRKEMGLPDLRPNLVYLTQIPLFVMDICHVVVDECCSVPITSPHGLEHYLKLVRDTLRESIHVQAYCNSEEIRGFQKEHHAPSFYNWLEIVAIVDSLKNISSQYYLQFCQMRLDIVLGMPGALSLGSTLREALVAEWHVAKDFATGLDGLDAAVAAAFGLQAVSLLSHTRVTVMALPIFLAVAAAETTMAPPNGGATSTAWKTLRVGLLEAGQRAAVALALAKVLQRDMHLAGDFVFDGGVPTLIKALATHHTFLAPFEDTPEGDVEPWLGPDTFACVPSTMGPLASTGRAHEQQFLLCSKLAAMLSGSVSNPSRQFCTHEVLHGWHGRDGASHPCLLNITHADDYALFFRPIRARHPVTPLSTPALIAAPLTKQLKHGSPAALKLAAAARQQFSSAAVGGGCQSADSPSPRRASVSGASASVFSPSGVLDTDLVEAVRSRGGLRSSRSSSTSSSLLSPDAAPVNAAHSSRACSVSDTAPNVLWVPLASGVGPGATPLPSTASLWAVNDQSVVPRRQSAKVRQVLQRGDCVQVKAVVHSAAQLKVIGKVLGGLVDGARWHTASAQTTLHPGGLAILDKISIAALDLGAAFDETLSILLAQEGCDFATVQRGFSTLFTFFKDLASFLDEHFLPSLLAAMIKAATDWAVFSTCITPAAYLPSWLVRGLEFVALVCSDALVAHAPSAPRLLALQQHVNELLAFWHASKSAVPAPASASGATLPPRALRRWQSSADRAMSADAGTAAADQVMTLHKLDVLLAKGHFASRFSLALLRDEEAVPFPVGTIRQARSVPPLGQATDSAGNVLVAKWQIGRRLGGGGYGTVNLCHNMLTGDVCAVKILKHSQLDTAQSASTRGAFRDEWRIMSSLSHPHLVRYLDIDERSLHIFMEFCPGGTLGAQCRRHPLRCDDASYYLLPILLGLKELHGRDLIHGDLKAENVLLGHNLVPKLADFGGITNWRQPSPHTPLMCTATHAAPEVLSEVGKPLNLMSARHPSSDIWSLGCLLVEMLTGNQPYFPEKSEFAIILNVTSGRLRPRLPPNCTAECLAFLQACLQHDHTRRPSCAALLGHAFVVPHLRVGAKTGDCPCGHCHRPSAPHGTPGTAR